MSVLDDIEAHGIKTLTCESCDSTVQADHLNLNKCPHCESRFITVEDRGSILRSDWVALTPSDDTGDQPDPNRDTAPDDSADSTAETDALGGTDRVARLRELAALLAAPDYLAGIQSLVYGVVLLPLVLLAPLVRVLPATWKLYRKLARWAIYQMQKATSADAIANVRLQSGAEDLRPAKWVEGAEDEKGRTGWKVAGVSGRWDPAVENKETNPIGKARLLHLDADETEAATWAEASMDNALQLDRERYLFRNATVRAVFDVGGRSSVEQAIHNGDTEQLSQALQNGLGENGHARTDGGQAQQYQYDISIERPGIHEDTLIPLDSREGFCGQAVSFSRYQELKSERSDQETVRDAKNTAWAAAKLDDIEGFDVLKWALIIGAWSAMLLFKDAIAAFISGLGSGGGGGGGVAGGVTSGIGQVHLTHLVDAVATLGVV